MRSKALLLGGALVAIGAAAMKNRNKVAGLIGARSSVPEPPPPVAGPGQGTFTSPQPSNYDLDGPAANTATHVPAPDPQVPESVDVEAEIAAAAAEAASIGGEVSDYASNDPTLTADDAERPVVEAGEGESEGQEQAEALLVDEVGAEPSGGYQTWSDQAKKD